MLTMHPTLLIGPSDWQAEVMPREEFIGRIETLWHNHPAAERAIVFGNPRHHAELAYFTNLVPKLEPAVALLSRSGEHRIHVGGPNMLGAARPLTWIADVLPLKDVAAAIRAGKSDTLLFGDSYMTTGFRRTIMEALGNGARAQDATAQVWMQMRRKSLREVAAMLRAFDALAAGGKVMIDAFESGASVTEVVLAGERAAFAQGAQDVRTLFSLDGGRTLRPFVNTLDEVRDPQLIYMAVRRFNYWVESFASLSHSDDPIAAKAIEVKDAAIDAIRSGIAVQDIAKMIAGAIGSYRLHPMTSLTLPRRCGLAIEQPPYTDPGATFEADEVYSLRVGLTDGNSHVICSSMFVVRDIGADRF